MNCPVDGTLLNVHAIRSIEVEECPQCKGIWLNADGLRRAKDDVELDLNWLDFDPWAGENKLEAQWSVRACPVCNVKMASLIYADTNVTIDYCAKKHGIWLDSGEFDAIIRSLEAKVDSASLSDYMAASVKEAREILSGQEGFLSEWRDFLTVMRLLEYRFLANNPKLAKVLASLQTSLPY